MQSVPEKFLLKKCVKLVWGEAVCSNNPNIEMAAARYSTDVLQEAYDPEPRQHNQTIDEAIQNLPLEIREIIYKEYVAIKLRERANLGWNKLHKDILKKPFSDFMQHIVPYMLCMECMYGRFGGRCYTACHGESRRDKIDPPSSTPLGWALGWGELSLGGLFCPFSIPHDKLRSF